MLLQKQSMAWRVLGRLNIPHGQHQETDNSNRAGNNLRTMSTGCVDSSLCWPAKNAPSMDFQPKRGLGWIDHS
jgi:hypothetical protein